MEDEDLKNEYVLNDAGLQFLSGYTTMPWIYGQVSINPLFLHDFRSKCIV